MPTARHLVIRFTIAVILTLGASSPSVAASVSLSGNTLSVIGADGRPVVGSAVDIVSADGTFTTQGFTDKEGRLCLIGQRDPAAPAGRNECLYLPDGEYRLFVGDEQPIRFGVRAGDIGLPPAGAAEPAETARSSKSSTALIVGAGILVVAGLAGGGGGSSPDQPPAPPDGTVSLSVQPQMLSGDYEPGVSPCPTTLGTLAVTNTGDVSARVTVVPIEGISTTGQGQLLGPGDSGNVTVLFNCLVISAIAGTIEVGLTADGQAASETIEVVVNFQ